MQYEPMAGTTITEAANQMVALANEHDEEVVAEFNGVEVKAKPNDDPNTIVEYYSAETERRHEEYMRSPEGQEAARRAEEARRRADAAAAEGVKPFSVKDKAAWDEYVEGCTDGYSLCTIRYAARWANLLEAKMAEGAKLEDIAKDTSREADLEGITGFMYGCAVGILSEHWEHGEQLRRWHNLDSQLGTEGEKANESGGVLNPALLNVGPAD